MEIVGYIAAIFIGLVLGLIGGGGSILTVPVLVYLFGISPVLSTSYSLIIVGVTSIAGVISYARNDSVSFKTGIYFSIPAMLTVYFTRRIILPAIPDTIFTLESIDFSKDLMIMLLFATLMIFAAISMIRKKKNREETSELNESKKIFLIVAEGIIVGVLTGLVGAGGGFLIIPALVLFAKMPMKIAVGTSLFVISVKSIIGFIGDLGADVSISWSFISIITLISILGMILGSYLSKYISNKKLKPLFGWFVLLTGSLIIIQNIFTLGGK
jgi:uncharacterized membrane protein YfcA